MATTLEEKQVFNKDLQNKIKELIQAKKVDTTTIARGINKSVSTVSLYLSSQYKGRVDNLEEELQNYLKVFESAKKTEFKSLKFIETNVVKRLYNAANMCRLRGKMGAVFGSPGVGKSTTIKEYQKTSSCVIVIDPCENSSSYTILTQMAEQLKIPYTNNLSKDVFINKLGKKLFKNKYLIIVDEAENLKIDCFKVLRKIYDRANGYCGLLFVGTEELHHLLLKVHNGFPYISSRIGYMEKLDALRSSDVEKLVLQYFPDCKEHLIKHFAKVSNFNARAIQNILDLCMDIVESNNISLDEDVIDCAKERLLI